MDIQLLESGENWVNSFQDVNGAIFTESVILPDVCLNDVLRMRKDETTIKAVSLKWYNILKELLMLCYFWEKEDLPLGAPLIVLEIEVMATS